MKRINDTLAPGSVMRPEQGIHLMSKPVGPACNMRCDYCFYREKTSFQENHGAYGMSDRVLEAYVKCYIEAQRTPEVEFTWQGGEPTIAGIDFFKRVLTMQRRHRGGKRIRNTLQTNGTLLDDEWGEFLAREGFLVGLSLDGPRAINDIHRHEGTGGSSFDRTVRGMDILKRFKIPFNVLVTVSRESSRRPLEIYRFLKENRIEYIQFNPVVERPPSPEEKARGQNFAMPPRLESAFLQTNLNKHGAVTAESVLPDEYGGFLMAVYDEWVRNDVGLIYVMNFEWALGAWCGLSPSVCIFSQVCGKAAVIEHDGSVYSCDHYVYPEYRLGRLPGDDLSAMMKSEQQTTFGTAKETALPGECHRCRYLSACNGECPKNRFVFSSDGEWGMNYLCQGYYRYFRHITQTMNAMAQLVAHAKPASLIMDAFRGPLVVSIDRGTGD